MKKARITALAVCAAATIVIVAAMPAVAAEQAQIADPQHDAIAQQAEVNHEAAQQAVQADQDGDDSQLGDQPGDANDDADVDGPDEDLGDQPGEENIVDQPPSTITTPTPPPSNPETRSVEPTPTSSGGHRRQLAYTGGNETLYMVLGTLFGLAGTGVLVGTVLSRKSK